MLSALLYTSPRTLVTSRRVAEWLTDQENHRTHSEHENALILKR